MSSNQVPAVGFSSPGNCDLEICAPRICDPIGEKDWRHLYRKALFEKDRVRAAGLILDAEQVISSRIRSLFHAHQNAAAERQALETALGALHLLRRYSRPKEFMG